MQVRFWGKGISSPNLETSVLEGTREFGGRHGRDRGGAPDVLADDDVAGGAKGYPDIPLMAGASANAHAHRALVHHAGGNPVRKMLHRRPSL